MGEAAQSIKLSKPVYSGSLKMYLSTAEPFRLNSWLGEPAPKAAPTLSKDAERRNALVAKNITAAIKLATDARPFLKTDGEKQLMDLIIGGLQAFFPTGFGTLNDKGEVVTTSTRMRYETMVQDPKTLVLMPYLFQSQLVLSDQISKHAGGQLRAIGMWASRIELFSRSIEKGSLQYLVGLGVHESIHMLRAMIRSFESKFGELPSKRFPSKTLASMLSVSSFADSHKRMEAHFNRLAKFLERDAGLFADRDLPKKIANLAVEEVMAFVVNHRAEFALAELAAQRMARRSGIGIGASVAFDPPKFVKNYITRHWFYPDALQQSLAKPEAVQIIHDMSPDVKALTAGMEAQIGR